MRKPSFIVDQLKNSSDQKSESDSDAVAYKDSYIIHCTITLI